MSGGNISLKVHSWGAFMPVPAMGTMRSVDTFFKSYYGYVVAVPPLDQSQVVVALWPGRRKFTDKVSTLPSNQSSAQVVSPR